jgi:hypothetical protein
MMRFVAHPFAQFGRIYEFFGWSLSREAEQNMRTLIASQAKRQSANHRYDLSQFGANAEDVLSAFRPYCERFRLSQLTHVRHEQAIRRSSQRIQSTITLGMRFEVLRLIHADHPSLPGHFPGAPLVPGVVILDEVVAAVDEWRRDSQLSGVRSVKFLAPLKPEQPFTISLSSTSKDAGEGEFLLSRGRTRNSRGSTCSDLGSKIDSVNAAAFDTHKFQAGRSDPPPGRVSQGISGSDIQRALVSKYGTNGALLHRMAVDLLGQLNLAEQLGAWRSADELCSVLGFSSAL